MALQTEFEFTLPKGYVDADGTLHRAGVMRLATAAGEILPMKDPRVKQNHAYLAVIVLSRVITKLGDVSMITPKVIEELFAADLAFLQDFYQRNNQNGTPDVTATCPNATFTDPARVRFLWAFPDYASFDTNLTTSGTTNAFGVSDATPGGKIRFYGDLKATANAVEKSVGFTWSDPAVGTLTPDRSINVAIVGSGYFPSLEEVLVNRKTDAVRAGRSFYLIDLSTERVLRDPSTCGGSAVCFDVGDLANPARKIGLQADPTAGGATGDYVVTKAYLGDLDGRYWRFNFNQTGAITATPLISTGQPIYNSSESSPLLPDWVRKIPIRK